ncbi:MAG: proline racemase, partial [Gammaproteobacteria bacterium]
GRVDRSPCGTGNSARMAVMSARGEVKVGVTMTAKSIIDSEFLVRIEAQKTIDGMDCILPSISGRGSIHGIHQIGVDPSDPYQQGYKVSDCWGDAFDLLN